MKTERRHELQTNQLADSLGHWIEAIEPYKRLVAGGAVLVVLLIAALVYANSKSSAKVAAAWNDYFKAANSGDPNQLDDTAEKYPGTPVAIWSYLVAADIRLAQGNDRLLKDKHDGRDQLHKAEEGYELVLKDARDPMLKQRAMFGLARTQESLGNLPDARKSYDELAKKYPNGPFLAYADRRAADLNKDSTKEFYDWLAHYEPPAMKSSLTPGLKPDFSHESLDNPDKSNDIKLPSVVDLLPSASTDTGKKDQEKKDPDKKGEPSKDSPAEVKPEGDAKKEDAKPPAEAKPATDAKSDAVKADAPKTDTKPAEPELKAPEKSESK